MFFFLLFVFRPYLESTGLIPGPGDQGSLWLGLEGPHWVPGIKGQPRGRQVPYPLYFFFFISGPHPVSLKLLLALSS